MEDDLNYEAAGDGHQWQSVSDYELHIDDIVNRRVNLQRATTDRRATNRSRIANPHPPAKVARSPLIQLSYPMLLALLLIVCFREANWALRQWDSEKAAPGDNDHIWVGSQNRKSLPAPAPVFFFVNRFTVVMFLIWIYTFTMLSIHSVQLGYLWLKHFKVGGKVILFVSRIRRFSICLLCFSILASKLGSELWTYFGKLFQNWFACICWDSEFYACNWADDLEQDSKVFPEPEKVVFSQLGQTFLAIAGCIAHVTLCFEFDKEDQETQLERGEEAIEPRPDRKETLEARNRTADVLKPEPQLEESCPLRVRTIENDCTLE